MKLSDRLGLEVTGGVCDVTPQDLKDWGLYYHRPADELIFLTLSEHSSLHNKGNTHSKGRTPWNRGKKIGPLSEEHKRKISEASKGKKHGPVSEETKRKMSGIKVDLAGAKASIYLKNTRRDYLKRIKEN